ncbi:hypothetical protein HNP84_009149 [Thermocatellispora tengchongensis]|uniref:Uncharacterized protein n=1 Tax=Thermocatellispora tengchongensis TaxID=1073253 RepID=A0A840PKD4_9ACTN|nr:hypothetical protein [Thermocatellispora tengchongensis]MBB5139386.1 hypothetical protein [Thermocatellispora tengchongensis]
MLKKLVLGGVAAAAFAGFAFAGPAQAAAPWPPRDVDVAEQSGNVIVCGNHAIGDVLVTLIPLAPISIVHRDPVDCSISARQN